MQIFWTNKQRRVKITITKIKDVLSGLLCVIKLRLLLRAAADIRYSSSLLLLGLFLACVLSVTNTRDIYRIKS